jgi:hypothetical protein
MPLDMSEEHLKVPLNAPALPPLPPLVHIREKRSPSVSLEESFSTEATGTTFYSKDSFSTPSTPTTAPATVLSIPPKRQHPIIRNLRHTYLAVYQRLFTIVFVANVLVLVLLLLKVDRNSTQMLSNLSTASAANIMVAVLMRQPYMINFIFKSCWIIPKSAPLRLRRILAKVYEFGGVHSSAAISSTVWFMAFTVLLTKNMLEGRLHDLAVLIIAWILLLLLTVIIIFALPDFRRVLHNTFEITHRFGGWTALLLFWAELVLFAHSINTNRPQGAESRAVVLILLQEPAFWFLAITSAFVIWPWLLLRKLHIRPEYLSERSIRLHFTGYKVPPFSGISISRSPLFEWHPFACMATQDGGSVLISDAGDWTKDTVKSPRLHYWVKGIPVTGVLNMSQIFRKVVIVTTGSGIGPVLSYLIGVKKKGICRLIWSAPNPLCNFGKDICDTVMNIDSEANIINTSRSGRPDLVTLAHQQYIEFGAEAIFVLSNPRLTKETVYALESRGVPAFGPILDS